jgi:hypothetical protein
MQATTTTETQRIEERFFFANLQWFRHRPMGSTVFAVFAPSCSGFC